jgi:UDPglucose 6-dehydrogenase
MNIAILGTGYVGLVTGACLADLGNNVLCIDSNTTKINGLKKSRMPFYEAGLEEIVSRNLKSSRLSFSSSYKNISSCELIFFCIDTPRGRNGKPDLSNLNQAIDTLALNLNISTTVVMKSTVPIGTNKKVIEKFKKSFTKYKKDIEISICSNPEFLKEGSAVTDFLRPERIVVGAESLKTFKLMRHLYKPLNRKANKIIEMSLESAELTKYASNAFLATKISFINQIAKLAEVSNANIHEIRRGIGSDSRIGKDFLYAGLGFGGSCFPKDISALIETEKQFGLDSSFFREVKKINHSMVKNLETKITKFYKSSLKTKTILIWGLSFKPNTDDVRNSVAIKFVNSISRKVKKVYVYDPMVRNLPNDLMKNSNVVALDNQYQKISECHSLVICTEWKEFWDPDIEIISSLRDRVIFDGRNILDYEHIENQGIKYYGIGIGHKI